MAGVLIRSWSHSNRLVVTNMVNKVLRLIRRVINRYSNFGKKFDFNILTFSQNMGFPFAVHFTSVFCFSGNSRLLSVCKCLELEGASFNVSHVWLRKIYFQHRAVYKQLRLSLLHWQWHQIIPSMKHINLVIISFGFRLCSMHSIYQTACILWIPRSIISVWQAVFLLCFRHWRVH